ncbi:RDD family protein [Candidatus Woesearchaeota archaeon]|nr:RDD family protein [Candidatus Woesearchaeota archaeon]
MKYAGFILRLIAYIIDSVIITISLLILWIPICILGSFMGISMNEFEIRLATQLISFVAVIMYHVGMESSKYQGSIGKIIMKIKVTDTRGRPISFNQALVRNLCKILSNLILGIGHLMIIWDDRKQALHDQLSECLVLDR